MAVSVFTTEHNAGVFQEKERQYKATHHHLDNKLEKRGRKMV